VQLTSSFVQTSSNSETIEIGGQRPFVISLVAAFNKHLSALTTAAPNRSVRSHHIHLEEIMAHELPPLPYDYSALEPVIDTQTMKLHHDMHQAHT